MDFGAIIPPRQQGHQPMKWSQDSLKKRWIPESVQGKYKMSLETFFYTRK
jgi:hypothetical protein